MSTLSDLLRLAAEIDTASIVVASTTSKKEAIDLAVAFATKEMGWDFRKVTRAVKVEDVDIETENVPEGYIVLPMWQVEMKVSDGREATVRVWADSESEKRAKELDLGTGPIASYVEPD